MIGILTNEQVDQVLSNNVLGRIGCSDNNKTYIVPINYAFDGKSIVAHSTEGMKIEMMRKNPYVCFEVDDMNSFRNWKSVIAWGMFQELTDPDDQDTAMEVFVERMTHMKISETSLPHKMAGKIGNAHVTGQIKTIIFRILLTEKTGRFEEE